MRKRKFSFWHAIKVSDTKSCKFISVSFNITIAVLEEYLKRKVLTNIEFNHINKLNLLFYVDDISINKIDKRTSFKDYLNDNYTLDDIAQQSFNGKERNLHLAYKIAFDDETVFPEILKILPNSGFIASKMIPKLTRKIKKVKQKKKANNIYKNEKSVISLFNNSRLYDNTLFGGTMNNPADTINADQYQYFDSNNVLGSKKNSVSFARIHSNAHSNKHNSNFLFQDFQNIGKLINNTDIGIKKIDSSKIKNIKKAENLNNGAEICNNSDDINLTDSVNFDNKYILKDSPEVAKKADKYDEGLALLYDKIKTFN